VWFPLDGPDVLLEHVERNGPPAAMVVLAGVTPASGAALDTNTDLALACLDAAARAGIGRVLLASSAAVYGAAGSRPFTESDPLRPVNAYGEAKQRMEAASTPWRAKGIGLCCLRIGNVLGADALMRNATAASTTDPVRIDRFADGRGPLRSYIGPVTLARVLATLALREGALPQALNVAARHPVTMDALAEAAHLPWRWQPAPAHAHQRITMECRLLERFHRFREGESDPAGMVAQLDRVTTRA
ncbi:MAG: NAD-dependent epimerase/dehydratase family protein, partial [Paracoccaceae bacterium]